MHGRKWLIINVLKIVHPVVQCPENQLFKKVNGVLLLKGNIKIDIL